MDFYDPNASYNFTSTALLAFLLVVSVSTYLPFYYTRVWPSKVKAKEQEQADDLAARLAQIAANERVRVREIEGVEGGLLKLMAKFDSFQDSVHRRLDEIEDNRIDEMSEFIRNFIAKQGDK